MAMHDDQRAMATRFVAGVVRDAQHMADLTAGFLRSQGYRPTRQSPHAESVAEMPSGPAADFLLNLAAALRIAAWEKARIVDWLPKTLPPSREAYRSALSQFVESCKGDPHDNVSNLARQVFQITHQRFLHSSRPELNTDVLLCPENLNVDELLDALADFLWEHRHLACSEEK